MARLLHESLGDPEADLVEAAVAGLKTVQLLTGYERGVIIDSVCDGSEAGQVRQLREEDLGGCHAWISHGVGLRLGLELARQLSLPMPRELLIYVIAVEDPYTFGERLTPEVEKALPAAVEAIVADLQSVSAFRPARKH